MQLEKKNRKHRGLIVSHGLKTSSEKLVQNWWILTTTYISIRFFDFSASKVWIRRTRRESFDFYLVLLFASVEIAFSLKAVEELISEVHILIFFWFRKLWSWNFEASILIPFFFEILFLRFQFNAFEEWKLCKIWQKVTLVFKVNVIES